MEALVDWRSRGNFDGFLTHRLFFVRGNHVHDGGSGEDADHQQQEPAAAHHEQLHFAAALLWRCLFNLVFFSHGSLQSGLYSIMQTPCQNAEGQLYFLFINGLYEIQNLGPGVRMRRNSDSLEVADGCVRILTPAHAKVSISPSATRRV